MTNYTKQDYERDLQIVKNAPDDALDVTSYDGKTNYSFSTRGKGIYVVYEEFGDYPFNRSLMDIENAIAMYEANQRLISVINDFMTTLGEWRFEMQCTIEELTND